MVSHKLLASKFNMTVIQVNPGKAGALKQSNTGTLSLDLILRRV